MREKILSLLKRVKKKIAALTAVQLKVGAIVSSVVLTALIVSLVGVAIAKGNAAKGSANEPVDGQVASDVGNIDILNVVLPHSNDDADTKTNEEVYVAHEEISEDTILEMIEDTSKPVAIISYEDLNIGEDDSTDTNAGEVVAQTDTNSTSIYEYSGIVKGIDVSKWQGNIDWSQVAASGVKFAIIKCAGRSTGTGSLYEDPMFEKNIQGAIANGIQVGVYFFSQALNVEEAYEEASMTVQLISKYQITYPVAFDWESASGYRVEGQLSKQALTDICNTFAAVVGSYGYTPMIYFNRSDWRNAVNTAELTSKYKTWLATYFKDYYYTSTAWDYGNAVPEYPDIPYDIWQYGVTDTVPGISGWCDMDIAFFSYGNYEVSGMQSPNISVSTESISIVEGCDINGKSLPSSPEDGVDYSSYLKDIASGTNCIGYSATLSMVIKNSSGGEVDYWSAVHSPGTYTVTYSFVDPRYGTITRSIILYVTAKPTEVYTEPETESETETETGSEEETSDEESSEVETDNLEETTQDETTDPNGETNSDSGNEETSGEGQTEP